MGNPADERPRERWDGHAKLDEEGVSVIEGEGVRDGAAVDDFVVFLGTGDRAKGSFRCADCGYGVTVTLALPACPMCAGTAWEESAWSPFGRASDPL